MDLDWDHKKSQPRSHRMTEAGTVIASPPYSFVQLPCKPGKPVVEGLQNRVEFLQLFAPHTSKELAR